MTESEAFGERWWFKASDLEKNGKNVTIEDVSIKTCGKNYDDKPAVHFESENKVLPLNKTQFNQIVKLTGEEDTDNWTGYRIKLCPGTIQIKKENRNVDTIVIEPADRLEGLVRKREPAESSLAEVLASSNGDGDDESLPF